MSIAVDQSGRQPMSTPELAPHRRQQGGPPPGVHAPGATIALAGVCGLVGMATFSPGWIVAAMCAGLAIGGTLTF